MVANFLDTEEFRDLQSYLDEIKKRHDDAITCKDSSWALGNHPEGFLISLSGVLCSRTVLLLLLCPDRYLQRHRPSLQRGHHDEVRATAQKYIRHFKKKLQFHPEGSRVGSYFVAGGCRAPSGEETSRHMDVELDNMSSPLSLHRREPTPEAKDDRANFEDLDPLFLELTNRVEQDFGNSLFTC